MLYSKQPNEVVVPDWRGRSIAPGDTVLLRSPHPHAGKRGVYKWVERTAGGWMCLVDLQDGGDNCYVTRADQWERLKS